MGGPGSATPGADYPATATGQMTLEAGTTAETLAAGWIEDDDTERMRQRSLWMVLAGVGRTLATDAVDVIGDGFVRQPIATQATVGRQALRGRWGESTRRWRAGTSSSGKWAARS